MQADRDRAKEDAAHVPGRRPEMDEVNDASFDSFPASDAPVWSSMHAGPPRLRGGAAAPKPAAPDEVAIPQDRGGPG